MTNTMTPTPRRALRTSDAGRYLGISSSLLRKMRARGPDDPLGPGPAFIRLSASLIVYELAALDEWLDRHRTGPKAQAQVARVLAPERSGPARTARPRLLTREPAAQVGSMPPRAQRRRPRRDGSAAA
jgi:hypothetical protein